VAGGETAEIFGATTLEEDKRWRKFGFAKIASDSLPLMSAEVRAALENYARGVNAYIAALDDRVSDFESEGKKFLLFQPNNLFILNNLPEILLFIYT
jgi:acyl-homoserine lactone acylase PvdQ